MAKLNILKIFFLSFALTIVDCSGSVRENFETLVQISFETINTTGVFTKENFVDAYGNGNGHGYDYQIDQIISLMAKGTKRLTGIDSNYIAEVLNGRNEPPFQSQLNCIKDGLMEMRNVVINERNTAKFFRKSFKRPKVNINNCEDLLKVVSPHSDRLHDIYIPEVMIFRKFIPIYDSLNMLDLFVDYWNGKIKADLETIAIISADFANGSHQEALDYVNGISKDLTYPLSCLKGILDKGEAGIKSGYGAVLKKCKK